MRISEIKTIIAASSAKTAEAFREISARLVKLQERIDELVAGSSDPNVDDATFTAQLNQIQADANALADLVPDETVPPAPPVPDEPAVLADGSPVNPPATPTPVGDGEGDGVGDNPSN